MRRRRVAAISIALALIGCATPVASPTPIGPQPITDAEAAFGAAQRVAEIAGPFQAIEIVSGRFEDLDPESHNAPFDPEVPARWQQLADRLVWRVTLAGPDGVEAAVIDAGTGELLAAVVQGN